MRHCAGCRASRDPHAALRTPTILSGAPDFPLPPSQSPRRMLGPQEKVCSSPAPGWPGPAVAEEWARPSPALPTAGRAFNECHGRQANNASLSQGPWFLGTMLPQLPRDRSSCKATHAGCDNGCFLPQGSQTRKNASSVLERGGGRDSACGRARGPCRAGLCLPTWAVSLPADDRCRKRNGGGRKRQPQDHQRQGNAGKRALCVEWSRWRPPRLAADRGEAGPLPSPPVPAFGVSVPHAPPHCTRQARRTRKTALCYVTQTPLSGPGKLAQ